MKNAVSPSSPSEMIVSPALHAMDCMSASIKPVTDRRYRPRSDSAGPNASGPHKRTTPFVEFAERVLGLDRRDKRKIVPVVLRFGRGLGFVEIDRVQLSPIDANDPLAEKRIIGRNRLHLVDELDAVGRALGHGQRLDQ